MLNKARFKNPWFWLGLFGIVLTSMGVSPEMFTSWDLVIDAAQKLIANPFMLGSIALSLLGVFVDPTTKGLGDQ